MRGFWKRLGFKEKRFANPKFCLWSSVGKLLVLVAALNLADCSSIEVQGTQPAQADIPAAAPRTVGIEAANAEHKRMVSLFGGEYHDAKAERYLNDILVKLANAGDRPSEPYKVTILNSPVVNAFALPPNNLYATRGLLALANDASEIAAVMAHEIAHITARHAMQRAEQEKRAAVISQAASVIQSRQKGEEVEASAKQSFASFSRQQELEADEMGIKNIAHAGFDPYGATRFLVSLGRWSAFRASLAGQTSSDKPDLLATHPSTPERVAQATIVARQIGAPGIGTTDHAAYLAAIDGLLFGDDPSEGSIRGRRFIHPRLGFTFIAPEGFVLENSAQAVLGVKGGGTEALRLDSVHLAQSTTLESYIASGWVDGLVQSSVASTEINTMKAATATARAGEWNFLLAVVRFDPSEVYRLIFAVHSLNDDVEARFQVLINSFRRIAPEEASAVHPLRLAVVAAKDGDSVETLASRMVVPDRPLDYFLLLNGIERGAALHSGETYKIVIE
jgi:predicted Zn-dependent protease